MTLGDTDPLALAHDLLRTRVSDNRHDRSEDPDRPETVQAMQIALHVPKADPPRRTYLLAAAARAVVAVCLDERVSTDPSWRGGLEGWYDHLIRKVARRARNKAWADVQAVPGVTVDVAGAQARAFVPSAVVDTPPVVRKLQIQGTELPQDEPGAIDPQVPTILIDRSLHMSTGKAAAQVGHASMLLAARRDLEWVRGWAARGFVLNVREVDHSVFEEHAGRSGVVTVRDAGFTEVAPDALTVLAFAD
ncbi:peptidyl-tRNA hydrolase [Corynebacterium comes]|uniref:peptidyl-tRNA hydrolase n=1 Tax=Corynebacterium comes TaxID=2675218 RepID=A0A6B8VQT7_9CORY|nr:peptidyl-tRNA hydrolase [Corynebacterium comes]QGU05429.1 peptidyl-tRNA hydrolase [Corynebacterium comes]